MVMTITMNMITTTNNAFSKVALAERQLNPYLEYKYDYILFEGKR